MPSIKMADPVKKKIKIQGEDLDVDETMYALIKVIQELTHAIKGIKHG